MDASIPISAVTSAANGSNNVNKSCKEVILLPIVLSGDQTVLACDLKLPEVSILAI